MNNKTTVSRTFHSMSHLFVGSIRLTIVKMVVFAAFLAPTLLFGQAVAGSQRDLQKRNKASDAQNQEMSKPKADKNLSQYDSLFQKEMRLMFEQNVGQLGEPSVFYRTTDAQATYFFRKGEIRSVVGKAQTDEQFAYALQFVSPNENATLEGRGGGGQARRNYFNENGNHADVPQSRRLHYNDLWAGVNAVFFEKEGTMKYDFNVSAGADPSVVKFKMGGVTDLKINAKGELQFMTPFGELQKGKPFTYQIVDGKQKEIESAYQLNGDVVSFKLGTYDKSLPLTIDPIALLWSAALSGAHHCTLLNITVDPVTSLIYGVGYASQPNFPARIGAPYNSADDGLVFCLSADGTTILWSTYLGGSNNDKITGIARNAAGDLFFAGETSSNNYPTNGTVAPYSTALSGYRDAVVGRLSSDGTVLKYSSYITAPGDNIGKYGIGVYGDKIFYGTSGGSGFLTTPNALQPVAAMTDNLNAGVWFAINTAVPGAAGLEYASYLSGTASNKGYSYIKDLTTDSKGNIIVTGGIYLRSNTPSDFPMVNPIQTYEQIKAIGFGNYSAGVPFIARFDANYNLNFSSFVSPIIDKTGYECESMAVAFDASDNMYTLSDYYLYNQDLTVPQHVIPPQVSQANYIHPITNPDHNPSTNPIVRCITKILANPAGKYEFVSYMNGGDAYYQTDIQIDKLGRIHIVGAVRGCSDCVSSPGAIMQPPPPNTGGNPFDVGSYAILSPDGSALQYFTVLPKSYYMSVGLTNNGRAVVGLLNNDNPSIKPITPTYRDPITNTQKTVISGTPEGGSGIFVFHEPAPVNTIPDFAVGNNTFCVDALIYQNPNDGPIIGNTLGYTSGDGSSPMHNLPDLKLGAVTSPHPTPGAPKSNFQWQKSYDGTTWVNIPGAVYDVLKPDPEAAAATVRYRRNVLNASGQVLNSSNVATATIVGALNITVTAPTKPVYFCPGTVETTGIAITGSGNITWQWYNGYAPMDNTHISPASGSGTTASFTSNIQAGAAGGLYRLVVTDVSTGCKKEVLVTILPLTAKASNGPIAAICPGGTNTATLGPVAVNPDWSYAWTGPSGFTSSVWNPNVNTSGNYFLQVKEIGDASFCVVGETTVNVTPATPWDPALTPIPDKPYCQSQSPSKIGLVGTQPAGYTFQWVPAQNIDDAQAYSPFFDPGIVQGGPPIGNITYTFSALRLSDGCIYEDVMMVSDTALGFAFAGNDKIGDGCVTGQHPSVGGAEAEGTYFQWVAIKTDFAAGFAALTSHARFGNDVLGQQMGTNKFLHALFPLCSDNGNVGYWIDYEQKAAYTPFPNNCFTIDTVRVYVPCCNGISCPEPYASRKGTDGSCSSPTTTMGVARVDGATYVWRTYSIDGVIQGPNVAPQGLFAVTNNAKGAAISATGPHPTEVIVDFDDATWGWLGKNVVVYEVTQTIDLGYGPVSCFSRKQFFSGINSTPVIGVKDNSFCTFPSPGIRLGTNGRVAPYTISGADYTQAPNSAFEWAWSGGVTSGGATPFPVINPTATTMYIVNVKDPVTGCTAIDTLIATITPVIANAGPDLSGVCDGSLVQIGTESKPYLTYEWSPAAGLNFPIGTANNLVSQPYLLVPGAGPHTYTLQVTDAASGCQATDAMVINTNTTPAVAPGAQGPYAACPNAVINPFILPVAGYTYQWSAGTGADLAWLSSTTIPNTKVTLPANFTGPATFRLTATKGNCGSAFTDYVFNYTPPTFTLGPDITAPCSAPFPQIGVVSANGYSYTWSPTTGLYGNNTATTYLGWPYSQAYVKVATPTTFTLTRRHNQTGCTVSDDILVTPPAPAVADAGADKYLCAGVTASIGASGTGTAAWTAVGYSSNSNGAAATPTAGEATTMLGYLSSTSTVTTNFSQTTVAAGKYVYRLTTTLASCTAYDEVTVVVNGFPSDFGGSSQAVCANDEVLIGLNVSGAYSAFWTALSPGSANNTIVSPLTKQTLVRPTVTTVYNVRYTETASGCFADDQVTVTVTPSPVVGNVTVPAFCTSATAQDLTGFIPSYNTYLNPKWYVSSVPGALVGTPTSVTPTKPTSYFVVTENQYACRDTAEIAMNVETPETPNIAPTLSVNCSTPSINLATYQGTPSKVGNTLEWHNANNTDAASLLSSTTVSTSNTYYLFEKAPSPANCYSASDNIVVSFNGPPTVIVTQTAPTCTGATANNNGKITFTSASNSDKYFINSGATSTGTYVTATNVPATGTDIQMSIPNTGGSYTIRFYNASDACYKDTTVTIAAVTCVAPCALTASATGTDVKCNGGTDGTATLTVTGTVGTPTYAWSNSATTKDLGSVAAGTYTVTITEGVCTANASVTINEPTVLAVVCAKVDVTTNGGNNGEASVTPSGGTSGYTYLWSNVAASTTASITGLVAGTYTVTVTDAKGCTKTCSSTVNEPGCTAPSGLTITQTAATCSGGPNNNGKIILTNKANADKYGISSGATYTGAPYASATVLGSVPPSVNLTISVPNIGGTYTMRFFNGADACFIDQTVTAAPSVCTSVDLALTKTVDNSTPTQGGNVVFTIKVKNEGTGNATGVTVHDTLPVGMTFVSATPSGAYDAATKLWTIGNLNASAETTLTMTVRIDSVGVNFNTAEVHALNETDTDSSPNNGVTNEDDIARVCVTVPVPLCTSQGKTLNLTIPTGFTNIKWFKNGVEISGQTANILTVTQIGDYTFTATEVTCPVEGCCPLKVVEGNCALVCKPVICLPVTVMRQ
jgi:uncharacterized repeat protein (TIGR01451 family)